MKSQSKTTSHPKKTGLESSKSISQTAYESALYIPKAFYKEVMKGDLNTAVAKVVTFYEANNLLSTSTHPAIYYAGKLALTTAITVTAAVGFGSINKFSETIDTLAHSNQNTKNQTIKGIENKATELFNDVADYFYNPLKHVDLLAPVIFALTLATGHSNNAIGKISCSASKLIAYNAASTLAIAGSYLTAAKIAETTSGKAVIDAMDYVKDSVEAIYESATQLVGISNQDL